jgi:hypothetical protein
MTAALHAVLIGVSAYPHLPNGGGAPAPKSFGLKQLSSSALSAFRMHEWLTGAATKLPLPLGSVELLVSPSAGELAAEPRLAGRTPATRAEVVKAMKSLKAALERLLAIGERGVPIFREGVSLTLDRLRVYASVKKGLSPGSSAKARRLLEELEVITKTLDPLEPFTTLRGVDVRDVAPFPSDAPEPHDKEQPQ